MATWFLLTCPPQFSPFCFFGFLHFPSVPRYPCPINCSKLQSYCAEFLSLLQTRHVLSAFLFFTFSWNPWLTFFHSLGFVKPIISSSSLPQLQAWIIFPFCVLPSVHSSIHLLFSLGFLTS